MSRKVAPCGSWESPISAALVAREAGSPTELTLDGDRPYWLELRPQEGGRYALCTLQRGNRREVLDGSFNVRTRVHEYGGGPYLVHGGIVHFTNFSDQRLYLKDAGKRARPISAEGVRYADLVFDEKRARLVGVSEDHKTEKVANAISEVSLKGSSRVLVSGNDFYSSPRLDASQERLAWLTWNHPNMPWDGTELWVAELKDDGSVSRKRLVAGGRDESVFQPEWSPDGSLYFVSDKGGWWNLHRWTAGKVKRLVTMKAEFGRPQWAFGMSTYAVESAERLVCSYLLDGGWNLATLDTASLRLKKLKVPFTTISCVRSRHGWAFFIGASPTAAAVLVTIDLANGSSRVMYGRKEGGIDRRFISVPRHLRLPTTGGKSAYAFFYPPRNGNYSSPRGERPPLVVVSHGGPTSFSPSSLNLGVQYWTSRGFAVLDVNYRGSTGYGRRYTKELEGEWGIVDVDDCANGALSLARQGKADGKRLIIRGGSAGGYTTLCALTFKRVFRAGASYFGVSDLEGLEKETHKFESRYSDRLVAPYPERRDVYIERSPLCHTERISTPVIFFQGQEDAVVPPNQAERMVAALRAQGVPVAYIAFEGEQHGFRKAETVTRAYEAELYFYSRVMGFDVADRIEPVEIENLRPESS